MLPLAVMCPFSIIVSTLPVRKVILSSPNEIRVSVSPLWTILLSIAMLSMNKLPLELMSPLAVMCDRVWIWADELITSVVGLVTASAAILLVP